MAQFSINERNVNERNKFFEVGKDRTAIRVNDATMSTNKLSIAGETVNFTAGAAGTTGTVSLDKAPVYSAVGDKVGDTTSTSFAWVTGTVLTTEVAYNREQTTTVQLAALSNGEYVIDYDTGLILYKKATTGTSDTCNYTTRQLNVELTGTSVTTGVSGDTAHDAVDSGEPVKVGFKAYNIAALPSDVASGDRVNGIAAPNGMQYIYVGTKLDDTNDSVQAMISASSSATGASARNVNLNSTTTSTNIKLSAGNFYGVTEISTDPSHNSLVYVQLWDGGTAGSLLRSYLVPASSGVVGVIVDSRQEVIPQSFASTLVMAVSSTPQTFTAYAGTGQIYINISYR